MNDPFYKRTGFWTSIAATLPMVYMLLDGVRPSLELAVTVLMAWATFFTGSAIRPTTRGYSAPKGPPPFLALLLVASILAGCGCQGPMPGPGPNPSPPPIPVPPDPSPAPPAPPQPAPAPRFTPRATLEAVHVGDPATGLPEPLRRVVTPDGEAWMYSIEEQRPEGGWVSWEIHVALGRVTLSLPN